MFDINDDANSRVTTSKPKIDGYGLADDTIDNEKEKEEYRLCELHALLMSYYRQELNRQGENRYEMAIDEDYYDNIQINEEMMQELEKRNQPAIVYNVIAQTINWVIGSEKRGRTDFSVLPRTKEDAKAAERKTKLLKYISDVNRTPFHRSRAFEDAVKVGIGWMETGLQDEDDGEPVYTRYESWRNVIHDSASTELDFSDGRYIFRPKHVDADIMVALLPDKKEQIMNAVSEAPMYASTDYNGDEAMDSVEFDRELNIGTRGGIQTHKRKRLKVIECEYRVPEKVEKLKGGAFNGEIYDANDNRHVDSVLNGSSMVVNKVMMRIRVAIMTNKDILWEGPSPYRHNRFRFVPIWCFRRGRDNLPYGMIRSIRDIQDDVNKRASKAQHILCSNKVIMDEGALADGMSIDAFAEEIAKPDAIIIKKHGKEMVINADRELAPAHLDLMSRGINMIQQVGGVTDELLGRTTNAVSGIAVQKRQEQGSLATNKVFDNLRLSEQMRGELELSLIEQFYTEQKQFRITNQRGEPEFIGLNDGLPENDITRSKADFILSEAEWRATMRQAAAEQLFDIMGKMPAEVSMTILDLAVECLDLPNRDEIVKRIRAVNGQKDPDQTEVTPEEQANLDAQAKQQAFNEQMMQAQLDGILADNAKKQAEAEKAKVTSEKEKASTLQTRVNATNTAMQAATSAITMPTIAKVADGILQEAGWKDYTLPINQQSIVANNGIQTQQEPQP